MSQNCAENGRTVRAWEVKSWNIRIIFCVKEASSKLDSSTILASNTRLNREFFMLLCIRIVKLIEAAVQSARILLQKTETLKKAVEERKLWIHMQNLSIWSTNTNSVQLSFPFNYHSTFHISILSLTQKVSVTHAHTHVKPVQLLPVGNFGKNISSTHFLGY